MYPSESPVPKSAKDSGRRSSKPAMERRRRQRINQCLSDLKMIILSSMKASDCPRNVSKLEKADILELTVRHLRDIHQSPPHVRNFDAYQAGYSDCAREACRFLSQTELLDSGALQNLAVHLNNSSAPNRIPPTESSTPSPSLPERIAPSVPSPAFAPQMPPFVVPVRGPNGEVFYMVAADRNLQAVPQGNAPVLPRTEHVVDQQVLDFSLNALKNIQHLRSSSISPSGSHSSFVSSDSDNVWRPW